MTKLRLSRLIDCVETRLDEPAGLARSTYFVATMLPRVIVQLASVAALGGLLSSCVPAKQYEAAESAAKAQAEARARDRSKLVEAQKRIDELATELKQQQQALDSERTNVAASKLETTVAQKDREAAGELVTQLQSDLARAGDHLVWYSKEKRDLGKAILLMEQRMDAVERASGKLVDLVGASRDLSLLLGKEQSMGELALGSEDGVVVLGVPEGRLFAENSDALIVDAAPVLAGVARAAVQHSPLKLVIKAPSPGALESSRGGRLVEALVERTVPRDRVSFEAMPADDTTVATAPTAAPGADAATAMDTSAKEDKPVVANDEQAKTTPEVKKAEPGAEPAAAPRLYSFRFVP